MVAVPGATPVTTPEGLTVATEELVQLQTPPATVSTNVVEEPVQIMGIPVIVLVLPQVKDFILSFGNGKLK